MWIFTARQSAARLSRCCIFPCQLSDTAGFGEKPARVKRAPGSLHVCSCSCKLQLGVLQALLGFGDRRCKSGTKTTRAGGLEMEEPCCRLILATLNTRNQRLWGRFVPNSNSCGINGNWVRFPLQYEGVTGAPMCWAGLLLPHPLPTAVPGTAQKTC